MGSSNHPLGCDFHGSQDLGLLIISCIFLCVFMFVLYFWVEARRSRKVSKIFPGCCFEIALVWALVNYILSIVDIALFDCTSKALDAATSLSIAVNIIGQLQDLTALGVILLCLTPATKVSRYIIATIMAVLVALFVPFMIIQSNYWTSVYEFELTYDLYNLALNLSAAYYFLLLCAVVCALLLLLFLLPSLGRGDWLAPSAQSWAFFTLIALCIQRLFVAIAAFTWSLPGSPPMPTTAAITFDALTSTASAASYFGAAMTAWRAAIWY
jgi:hypothetical protein